MGTWEVLNPGSAGWCGLPAPQVTSWEARTTRFWLLCQGFTFCGDGTTSCCSFTQLLNKPVHVMFTPNLPTVYFQLSIWTMLGSQRPAGRSRTRWPWPTRRASTWPRSQPGLWWCERADGLLRRSIMVVKHSTFAGKSLFLCVKTFIEWETSLSLLWYNSWEQHEVHLVTEHIYSCWISPNLRGFFFFWVSDTCLNY